YFGNPKDQIRDDFAAVGFVEHFMSSSGVKMMRDICDARFLITLHEKTNALQLQANWVFTAGKQIDRQVRSNSMQVARVGEFTSCRQEGFHRAWLEFFKTQRVIHEGVRDRRITT